MLLRRAFHPRGSESYLKASIRTSGLKRPPLAFVFDIDGVLIRGPDVLPAAKRALTMLEGDNPFKVKLPYILLTNGGGESEKKKCERLTEKLGFRIEPQQYIQAHTVLKSLARNFMEKPVLVLGGKLDQVRRVAAEYGFKKAYTTSDILAWNPSVWPFHELTPSERAATKEIDFSTPISAVFVFHDPRNWALDVQVVCDVIQSGGLVGGPYDPKPLHPVELFFCNPDLVWRSDFDKPRLGQGAFKTAFQAVFKSLTGSEYPYVQFGKPSRPTYDFASQVLSERLQYLGYDGHLPRVYMVGDNPESDIAGANAAKWESILVKTGVYSGGELMHTPTHQTEDVEEAVRWAIARELEGAQAQ